MNSIQHPRPPLTGQLFRWLALVSILAIGMASRAAAAAGGLYCGVKGAHEAGLPFEPVHLFSRVSGTAHPAVVSKEAFYLPDAAALQRLLHDAPQGISIQLTDADGTLRTIEFLRSHPLADGANMGFIDAQGRHSITYDAGLHYQGCVAGMQRSMAALSLYADGTVMLLFADSSGNYNLGRMDDGSGTYVLYNDRDLVQKPTHRCETAQQPSTGEPRMMSTAKTTSTRMCNKVQLYWEIGYDLYKYHGSDAATRSLILGEFNQVQAFYANDSIAIELKSMYIWHVPDNYGATPLIALSSFTYSWGILGLHADGDLGHFITRGSYWGYSYVYVLCSPVYPAASSRILSSYSNFPVYSNDLYILAHETGHNLGSQHTHACVWPTGPGGSCGAIDDCGGQEPFTCSSCAAQFQNTAPVSSWTGTIMSYCEKTLRGVNLSNGFGPLPGALVRSAVSNAACLKSIIQPRLTTQQICNADGAISLSFTNGNFGVPPYTFLWSNGMSSQNLSGLSTAGAYSVSITDANGCSTTDTTQLRQGPASGNSIQPSITMPICCDSSAPVPLLLQATPPQGLSACETVYWLRSDMPLVGPADAQAYFDTASGANIIRSNNADSLNSGIGAQLSIRPPQHCAGPQSWYYTPVIATRAMPMDSVIASSSVNTPFTLYGSNIGSSVGLPDQTALTDLCGVPDSLVSKSFVVTVTNYTGRPNLMRIVVTDSANRAYYEAPRSAGNGTYTIPDTALGDNFSKAMIVRAFDMEMYDSSGSSYIRKVYANVSARRVVRYAARAPRFIAACSIGSSLKVDFAPQNCTKLGLGSAALEAGSISLYPNPAKDKATLRFIMRKGGSVRYSITDMPGRKVIAHEIFADGGEHRITIETAKLSTGVYFLTLAGTDGTAHHIRFVVE